MYSMDKNVGFNIIDSKEWESVIEVTTHSEAQMHLNQWRHSFDIIIITCIPVPYTEVTDYYDTYLSILRKPRAV